MRYVMFSTAGHEHERAGVLRGETVVDLAAASRGALPPTVLAIIQQGAGADRRARQIVEQIPADHPAVLPLRDVRLHAPIPRPPRNVFCLGLNYLAHARESARARGRELEVPRVPVFFTKATTSVCGPDDDVMVDRSVTSQVDWEVELGVVVGVAGRNIPKADAHRHIFGYTVVNDLSARDLQSQHLQWFKGKSLDGFCPMGPAIVTADEFGDPQAKRLRSRVNGEPMQDSTTADMIFAVDAIVEWLSKGLTLEPGDIIATGTPEGVGMGRTPPRFLDDGDIVEVEVEGIGTLRNRIRVA